MEWLKGIHFYRSAPSRCLLPPCPRWLASVQASSLPHSCPPCTPALHPLSRKVPRDLTEATLAGGTISLISTVVMAYLFITNFSAFLSVDTKVRSRWRDV